MRGALIAALITAVLFVASLPVAALPPREVIIDAVEQSPAVAAARSETQRAEAEARRLSAGPYEVQLGLRGGQRRLDIPIDGDTTLDEWGATVSRTIRLPGKRRLDRQLAETRRALANARLDKTRLDAQLLLLELWLNWENAWLMAQVSQELASDARRLAQLEQKNVDLGGQRQLFADRFAAEADLAELTSLQDQMALESARIALSSQFETLLLPDQPGVTQLDQDLAADLFTEPEMRALETRLVQLLDEESDLTARRALKNTRPDPTVGLSYGSEFAGQERAVMASITLPIGGGARRAAADEASAFRSVQTELNEQTLRSSERRFQLALNEAKTLDRALPQATRAAQLARSAVQRLRRGYELGGVSETDLLNATVAYREAERTLRRQRGARAVSLIRLAVLSGRDGLLHSQ